MIGVFIDTPALGDTIAALPTCKKIRQAYPDDEIHVITNHPYLFEGIDWIAHVSKPENTNLNHFHKLHRLFMPLVGNSYQLEGGETIEFRYSNMDIRQFHAISQGFTLSDDEMETELFISRERKLTVSDYVILHPTQTWATRTWSQQNWQELADRLAKVNIPVVAIGRSGKEQGFYDVDKPVMELDIKLGVNLLDDPDNDVAELRWMMNNEARCVVTMDSGILHVAGTTDVNIIQLGSSINPKLRAPWRKGSQQYKYNYVGGGCDIFCSSNMKYNALHHGSMHGVPPQVFCLENKPTFECHPTVDQVFDAVVSLYHVKPTVKLVHLLLKDDADQHRQNVSIDSISKLKDYGIEYIQVWNDRWKGEAPRETFARPDEYDTVPITSGHYGNFRAFADAAKEHWTEELDAFIFCEGDAILVKSPQETVDEINRAYEACKEMDIAYFSFGDRHHLEDGSLQSTTWEQQGDIHLVDRVIGAQLVMIPTKFRKFTLDRFIHHVWDAADIFFNNIFTHKFNIGIFTEPVALQVDGVSSIDLIHKKHEDDRARVEGKVDRAYVAHCNHVYAPVVEKMLQTVRKWSNIPAFVYVYNSDYQIQVEGVKTINKWMDLRTGDDMYTDHAPLANLWVERTSSGVYDIITKKVDACLDTLQNYADKIVYLDADSVATDRVEELFDYYNDKLAYPKFTTSVMEYMMVNGYGSPFGENDNTFDLTKTIEYPVCQLLDVDINNRNYPFNYIQTCYFVAGQKSIPFFEEWKQLCYDERIVAEHQHYVPFHEETLANVLLWKYNYREKMPQIYVNATSAQTVNDVLNKHYYDGSDGIKQLEGRFGWCWVPNKKEQIKIFHGEKRPWIVNQMLEMIELSKKSTEKMKILFLAPHLSTGGMPAFLLRRIQELQKWTNHEIFVAEWTNYSDTYTIQKNKIKELVGLDHFITLGSLDEDEETHFQNRAKLVAKCYEWGINIIHIDEIPEGFDSFNPFPLQLQQHLYDKSHPWRIVETCHNVWFKPNDMKKVLPDAFALVSPEHELVTFKDLEVTKKLITFPSTLSDDIILRDRKEILGDFGYRTEGEFHICNIGLWTPGKNQAYAIQLAERLWQLEGHKYQFHFIGNQAPNFEDYWAPLMQQLPPNCRVWGERQDPDTFLQFSDVMLFTSTWECMPIVLAEAAALGVRSVAYKLPQYHEYWNGVAGLTGNLEQDVITLQQECELSVDRTYITGTAQFALQHEALYLQVLGQEPERGPLKKAYFEVQIEEGFTKFINKAAVECQVEFWNGEKLVHQTRLQPGYWSAPLIQYFAPWQIRAEWADGEKTEWNLLQELVGAEANLQFGSSSLGDTISFMEAIVDWKQKYGMSRVNVCTYKNWLFDWDYYQQLGIYPQKPGQDWRPAVGMWELGVHMHDVGKGAAWIPTKNPRDWRTIYLGDVASDALAVEPLPDTRRPKLAFAKGERPIFEPYVVIATQSTAQAKYWNNPTGWQELVDWHLAQGYKVFIASSEHDGYMGNWYPKGATQLDSTMDNIANWIQHAEYFIGISSGLSWLAWALNAKVVLISGFTPEICEFQDNTVRVINKSVCNSCWQWEHFDKNKWGWCPAHEGTERQFECTKQITAQDVIAQIKAGFKQNK